MKKIFINIILIFILLCGFAEAKYIVNKDVEIGINTKPFYFEAEAVNDNVVMDKKGVNINISIKNFINDSSYNDYETEYEISMLGNNRFTISDETVRTNKISGESCLKEEITVRLAPVKTDILNPEEKVTIKITTTSPYKKEIEIPISINTNPLTLSGMELNFLIKNGVYAPEGDVYEYYSVDANRLKDETVKKIVFGKFNDYKNNVAGLTAEPVDVNGIGVINLYRKLNSDNKTYTIYILSEDGTFELSENAAWTFDKLYALESIENLHLVNTSRVVNMRDMFCDCAVLEDIDLSNFNTSKVTNMIGMFARCHELEYLDLLSFDVNAVKEINEFSTTCEKLKTIYVSNDWKLSDDVISRNMFAENNSLVGENGTTYHWSVPDATRAVIDGEKEGYLTSVYKLLDGIDVNHIIKGKSQTEIDNWTLENRFTDTTVTSVTFGMRRDYGGIIDGYTGVATDTQKSGGIKTYRIPNGNGTYSVYIICNSGIFKANSDNSWMFDKLAKLTKINNLRLLDTSNTTIMRDMFCDCQSLPELDVTNFNTSNVTSFQGMFARMYCIETLDLSSFNTSKATTMLNMFHDGISSTETIDEYKNAISKLKTIYVSNLWNTSKIETTEIVFNNNVNLVGGNGTVFNSNNLTAIYARIDAASAPGYLTLKK